MSSIDHATSANRSSVEAAQSVNFRATADRHREAQRWSAAAAAYCRYLEEHPEDAAVWVQTGICFKEAALAADPAGFRDADFRRSLAAYLKAVQLAPHNLEAHRELGQLYKLIGNEAEARASYERAGLFDPAFDRVTLVEARDRAHQVQTMGLRASPGLKQSAPILELLTALRQLPQEQDPFVAYFNAVGGYRVDKLT
jgi:tetratricopeptide (TPR) repeat protein